MRQAELSNWSLDAAQMADLCSSINQFFMATGVIPPQGATHPQPQVQHPAPPSAPQHPAQPHGAMHPKPSHHNQHGQHNPHNQHISTGQSAGPRILYYKDSSILDCCIWDQRLRFLLVTSLDLESQLLYMCTGLYTHAHMAASYSGLLFFNINSEYLIINTAVSC